MDNIYRGFEIYKSYTSGTWGDINKMLLIGQLVVFCIVPITIGTLLFIESLKKHKEYQLYAGLSLIILGIVIPVYALYQTGQSSFEKEIQQRADIEFEAQLAKQKEEQIAEIFMNNGKNYYVLPESFTNNGFVYDIDDRYFDTEGYFGDILSSSYSNDEGQSAITIWDSLLTNQSYRQARCSDTITLPCREVSGELGTMICTDWPDRLDCKLDMENARQLWIKIYYPKSTINEQVLLNSVIRKNSSEIKLL